MEALVDHECYMTTYSGSKFQKVFNMRCGGAPRRTRKLVEFDTKEELEKEEILSRKRKKCRLSLQMQTEMGNKTSDRTPKDIVYERKRRKSQDALPTVERSPPSIGRSLSGEVNSSGKKRKRVRSTSELYACTKMLDFTQKDNEDVKEQSETPHGWLKSSSINRENVEPTSIDSNVKVFQRRKVRVEAFEHGGHSPAVNVETMEVNTKVSNWSTGTTGSMIIREDDRNSMMSLIQNAVSCTLNIKEELLEAKAGVCGSRASCSGEQFGISSDFCLQTYVKLKGMSNRQKDQTPLHAPTLAHTETVIIIDDPSPLKVPLLENYSDKMQESTPLYHELTQQVDTEHGEDSLEYCKLRLGARTETECHEIPSQVVIEDLGCSKGAAVFKRIVAVAPSIPLYDFNCEDETTCEESKERPKESRASDEEHEGELFLGSSSSKDCTNVTVADVRYLPEENRPAKDDRASEGRREATGVKTGLDTSTQPDTSAHHSAICPNSLETLHEAGGADEVGDQSDELNMVAISESVRLHPAETEMVSEGAEKGCSSKEVNLDTSENGEGSEPVQGVKCEPESSSKDINCNQTHVEEEVLGDCKSVHNGYDTIRNSSMIGEGRTAREGVKEKLCDDLKAVEDTPQINTQLPGAKVDPLNSASQMTFTSNSHEKSGSHLENTSTGLPSTSWHCELVGGDSATVVTPTEVESAENNINAILDSVVTPTDVTSDDSDDTLKCVEIEGHVHEANESSATDTNEGIPCRLEEGNTAVIDITLCDKHEESAEEVTTVTREDSSISPDVSYESDENDTRDILEGSVTIEEICVSQGKKSFLETLDLEESVAFKNLEENSASGRGSEGYLAFETNEDVACANIFNTHTLTDAELSQNRYYYIDGSFMEENLNFERTKVHYVGTKNLGNMKDDFITKGLSTVGGGEDLDKETEFSPEIGSLVESFIHIGIPNSRDTLGSREESQSFGEDRLEDSCWSGKTTCSDMNGMTKATGNTEAVDVEGLLNSEILSCSSASSQDETQWPDSSSKGPSKIPCKRKAISPRSQLELLRASRPHRIPAFRIKLSKAFSSADADANCWLGTENQNEILNQSEIQKCAGIPRQSLHNVDSNITLGPFTITGTSGTSDSGEQQIQTCGISVSQALSPPPQSMSTDSPTLKTPSPLKHSSEAATPCQEHIAPGSPEHNKQPSLSRKTTGIHQALLRSANVSAFLKSNCESPGSPITPTKGSESSRQLKSILKTSCVRADMEVVPCQGSCKCPRCITTCDQAKIAMEFIASQMSYADRIAGRLLEQIVNMRTVMEGKHKSGIDRGAPTSSPGSTMKDTGSLDSAAEAEKWARKELLKMSRDSKRVCRLIDRGPRKIMFADEAGRRLCQVKLLPAKRTSENQ